MSDWPNLDKIFIADAIGVNSDSIEGGAILKDDFLDINPHFFDMLVIKPTTHGPETMNSVIYQERLRFFSDGSMERDYLYHTYPQQTIDGLHLLHPIGQKMLNSFIDDYKENKLKEEGEESND